MFIFVLEVLLLKSSGLKALLLNSSQGLMLNVVAGAGKLDVEKTGFVKHCF